MKNTVFYLTRSQSRFIGGKSKAAKCFVALGGK